MRLGSDRGNHSRRVWYPRIILSNSGRVTTGAKLVFSLGKSQIASVADFGLTLAFKPRGVHELEPENEELVKRL